MALFRRFALGLAVALAAASAAHAAEIKVVTDRTESHMKPLFEQFEKVSGHKVSAAYVEKGLIGRVEARPDEADLIVTKDADLLEIARDKGLLTAFASDKIQKSVPASFRDGDGFYFVDAYRARVIFYSKARVKPEQLSSYEDLASKKWQGKVCIRSGYHDYNLALFGQVMAAYGKDRATALIKGLHDNLAREPAGGDRDQAKAILEGRCDVALMNTYYHPIMMGNPEQKSWAEATGVFFPNQDKDGAFIMRSGLALSKAKRNVRAATELMEFFASSEGQATITNVTYQYPVNPDVKLPQVLLDLGAPSIKNGQFKIHQVSLKDVAKHREAIVETLNSLNFDKAPPHG